MPEAEFSIDTCIIVLSIDNGKDALLAGAIVDSVQKVIDIPTDTIQVSKSMGSLYREDFITGIGKVDDQFIMILNIDKVFSTDDLYAITDI
jgi:purine-binding chemotaxis protein CheW